MASLTKRSGRWILCLFLLHMLQLPIMANENFGKIYCSEKFHLAFCECQIDFEKGSYYDERKNSHFEIRVGMHEKNVFNALKGSFLGLYPIFNELTSGEKKTVRCSFWIPRKAFDLVSNPGTPKKEVRFQLVRRENYPQIRECTQIEIIRDENVFSKKLEEWKAAFKAFLIEELKLSEDDEIETLIHARWFEEFPDDRSSYSWKQEPFMKFLFSLSGLNDLQDAIPLNSSRKPISEELTELPPEPIQLPQTAVEPVELAPGAARLSKWVPRSCYYAEWQSGENFLDTLKYLACQLDRWSPDSYKTSADKLIELYLTRLGLSEAFLRENLRENVSSIVLAGWDPYFRSGTSILLLIKSKQPLSNFPSKVPQFAQLPDNVYLFSNSDRLMKMASNSWEQGKSLLQEPGFRYSRNRMKLKEGERENFFLYLSDWWLTNLLSPRWKMVNDRLNQLDAKIRLAFLLKVLYQREMSLSIFPDLNEIRKNQVFMSNEIISWLIKDLEDTPTGMKSPSLGGLFDHPPIDSVPFEKVGKSEASAYKRFASEYVGRWRQMDPVALQIVSQASQTRWISRLYQSPISNRSEFRSSRSFVSPVKVPHNFPNISGQAISLSLAVNLQPLGLMGGLNLSQLPAILFFQGFCQDFSPTPYSSVYWQKDPWEHDSMSYLRIPVTLVLPRILFMNGGIPIPQWFPRGNSEYEGIDRISLRDRAPFNLYLKEIEQIGLIFLSQDPNTLLRTLQSRKDGTVTDVVPCDLRAGFDFKEGYFLRRYFWYEAIKNRGVESWRRLNRIKRIHRYLGAIERNDENSTLDTGWAMKTPWVEKIGEARIFPLDNILSAGIVDSISDRNAEPSKRFGWSSVLTEFRKLPDLIISPIKLDFFVSIEENALLFETHFYPDPNLNLLGNTLPVVSNQTDTSSKSRQLDFDESVK